MKKTKLEEKIAKINTERKQMVETALTAISDNKTLLIDEVKQIATIIKEDDNNSKKYIELVKIQELIANLSEEIINADSKETIISIRKKLNYYINKVKQTMKKRGMSEEEINTYSEKVSGIRTNISKYLRYVKRTDNLKEIDELHENYENLSKEELIRYKKLLKLENNYNNRVLRGKNTSKKENGNKVTYITIEDNDTEESKCTIQQIVDETIETIKQEDKYELDFQDNNDSEKSEREIRKFVERQVNAFINRYNVLDINPYKQNIVKNIVSFIKNIPIYNNNKKRVSKMVRDFELFYGGNDLYGFIQYTKEQNSIKNGLKQVFSNTNIFSKDQEYLNNHEECISWIMDFCEQNNLRLKAWNN